MAIIFGVEGMGKEERVIKDKLQKLIERMEEFGYNSHMIKGVRQLVSELQKRGIDGVDKFVQRLIDSVNEKEGYLDILREGRTAIILASSHFSKIQIEYAEKGPDLKANYNKRTVYFEVTRSRPNEQDERAQSGVILVSPKRVENVISKIQGEMGQLKSGEVNIVFIWSDTWGLLPPDVEEAFEYIQQEIQQNPGMYKKLSGVLFTESGGAKYPKKFVLFKNDKASKLLGACLTKRLQTLSKITEELQR